MDGGSEDATVQLARPLADRVLEAPRGRARQMNAGAVAARGEVLLFLHADTILPDDAAGLIALGMGATRRRWGRFDVTIAGTHPLLPAVSFLMNPPSVEDMRTIALGGEKMPQKSTYYFPKILSGLVLWSLGDFE